MSCKNALLALILASVGFPAFGAEKDLSGNWMFFFPRQTTEDPFWLLQFKQADSKWSAKALAARERYPKADLSNFAIKNGFMSFTLTVPTARYDVKAKLPGDGASQIFGTVLLDGSYIPIELERTALGSLNRSVLDREILKTSKNRIKLMRAAARLIAESANLKAKPDEVKQWVDKALAAAGDYGSGFKRELILELLATLNELDGMATVALPLAQEANKLLGKNEEAETQLKVWRLLEVALQRAGKAKEAAEIAALIKNVDYGVRATPYAGRTGKSDRIVLAELFTGTECPPCIAADMAFDGLKKTYKPSEVVLLQYHLHIPGPDPLTNEDTVARFKYYSDTFPDAIRGTPTILFNGNPGRLGGGGKTAAQARYKQYCSIINPILDKTARASLKVSATRKGDNLTITVDASKVKDAAESTLLRVAIAEEEVSYTGGNKVAKHHFVVRGFAGSPAGSAVTKNDMKKTFTVDISALKKKLKDYLEKYNKGPRGPFPNDARPLDLEKLHIIAMLQDDNSGEVIQAAHAAVK